MAKNHFYILKKCKGSKLMNILYVSPVFLGFDNMLLKGDTKETALPAYIYPLKALVERGNNVDIIFINGANLLPKNPEYNIKSDWLKKCNIIDIVHWDGFIKKFYLIHKLNKIVEKAINSNNYDFIYIHGQSGAFTMKVANKYGIPVAYRVYGLVFLYGSIKQRGILRTKLKPNLWPQYKALMLKKDFMLVTDDGSKGDYVYNVLSNGKRNCDFYFWKSGVSRFKELNDSEIKDYRDRLGIEERPFLFYFARIDSDKRQDKAIDILYKLNNKGYNFNLYIAGHVTDYKFYQKLQDKVKQLGLKDNVFFIDALDKDEINAMCKMATASFSLYDICNMGNCFHEMLSAGAVIVASNDGSLDEFIENEKNGFLIDNLQQGVDYIIKVYEDKEYEKSIRYNAVKTSRKKMKTWEERVDDEIKLIEHYAHKNRK